MKIVLLVEGQTEDKALAEFLKRWLDAQALAQPVGVQTVRLQGAGEFIKQTPDRAMRALNAPKGDVVAVFALLDLYGCPLPYPSAQMPVSEKLAWGKRHLEGQVSHSRFRQCFAVHETEAWLLSDPAIFPVEVRTALAAKSQQPEAVNDEEPPAKLLGRLYNTHLGRGYRKAVDGPTLFRQLDPATAYSKCPSLRALLDEMLTLARQQP